MSRQRSCYAPLRRIVLSSLLLLGAASTAFAQFDRGTITGTVKDAQGGIVPGATVTITSSQTQQSNTTVTDGSGYYTFPNLSAGRYELIGRAERLQESQPLERAARRRRDARARLHSGDRRADRRGHRHRGTVAAAKRRSAAKDDRGQGHRANRLQRAQPDWRRRAEGGRRRRELQQQQLLQPHQRRLQYQRQPRQREQHHGRRRDGDPHAGFGRHRRRSERGHDPGDPGTDRRLHARVRTRERRADPHRHEER